MSYFLGVDLGGTVIKAGIYNLAGEEVAVCEHTANLLSEAEGFAERNMDEMWKAVCIVKAYTQLIKPEIRYATASSPQTPVLSILS